MMTYYYFRYCPSSGKCTITVVYTPRSYFQSPTYKNITSVKFTSVLHRLQIYNVGIRKSWHIDIAAKTRNNYISGTMTDSVEIPTPNSGFSMMTSSKRWAKLLRQRSTTRSCKSGAQNVYITISGCRSLSQLPGISFFELDVAENPIFAVGLVILCHSSRDISISGFGGHTAISGCRSLSQSLGDTLFGLAMVENLGLAVGISNYLL